MNGISEVSNVEETQKGRLGSGHNRIGGIAGVICMGVCVVGWLLVLGVSPVVGQGQVPTATPVYDVVCPETYTDTSRLDPGWMLSCSECLVTPSPTLWINVSTSTPGPTRTGTVVAYPTPDPNGTPTPTPEGYLTPTPTVTATPVPTQASTYWMGEYHDNIQAHPCDPLIGTGCEPPDPYHGYWIHSHDTFTVPYGNVLKGFVVWQLENNDGQAHFSAPDDLEYPQVGPLYDSFYVTDGTLTFRCYGLIEIQDFCEDLWGGGLFTFYQWSINEHVGGTLVTTGLRAGWANDEEGTALIQWQPVYYGISQGGPTPTPTVTPTAYVDCAVPTYIPDEPVVGWEPPEVGSSTCYTVTQGFDFTIPALFEIWDQTQVAWPTFGVCVDWWSFPEVSVLGMVIPMEILLVPVLIFFLLLIIRL